MAEEKSLREILKDVYNAGLGCGIRKCEDYDECGRIDQALSAIEAHNKARWLSKIEMMKAVRKEIYIITKKDETKAERTINAIFKAQEAKDK